MLDNEGVLTVDEETVTHYQFIDYTAMVEYLFSCIEQTIFTDFKEELKFIINYDSARRQIQHVIDMPDKLIDLIIKYIAQNKGSLSDTKRKRLFDMLTEKEIEDIEAIVQSTVLSQDKG